MSALRRAKTLNVFIARRAEHVYAYASNPENMPRWMTSFVRSVRRSGDDWLVETDGGTMTFRFVPKNDLGVLDHDVTLPSGTVVRNPMRVVPNGDGSEIMFTLFQLPEMSDADFARDAEMVERDLQSLRKVLEG